MTRTGTISRLFSDLESWSFSHTSQIPVQQRGHKHTQRVRDAPVLELAGAVLPAVDSSEPADVHRLSAHGGQLLPDRVLRLWLHGGHQGGQSDPGLGVDIGRHQSVRGVHAG